MDRFRRGILAFVTLWCIGSLLVGLASAGEKTITFGWTQTISADFAGWKLYKSTAPNVQVSAANLAATIPYGGATAPEYQSDQPIIAPDAAETTYYFVLTAFDTSGNESPKSNEVSAKLDFLPPGTPIQFKIKVIGGN